MKEIKNHFKTTNNVMKKLAKQLEKAKTKSIVSFVVEVDKVIEELYAYEDYLMEDVYPDIDRLKKIESKVGVESKYDFNKKKKES